MGSHVYGERHVHCTRRKDMGGVRTTRAIRSDRYVGLWDIFRFLPVFYPSFPCISLTLDQRQRNAPFANVTSANRSSR